MKLFAVLVVTHFLMFLIGFNLSPKPPAPPAPVFRLDAPNVDPPIPAQVNIAAMRNGLPVAFARSLAFSESRFISGLPPRVERDGSKSCGPLQLNDRSFPGACTMSDAENINRGIEYAAKLYRQCSQDEDCAVRAYRTGMVGR